MKRGLSFVVVLLVAVAGCTGMQNSIRKTKTEPVFLPSIRLLESVVAACDTEPKNKIAAVKKCFPLLDGKELVVNVTELDGNYDVVIRGEIPRHENEYSIQCKPSEKAAAKLLKNPELLKVGRKHHVKGSVERFREEKVYDGYDQYSRYTFELSNCQWREVAAQK